MSVSNVSLEIGRLREGLDADRTLERSLASMRVAVPLQFGWCDEAFAALFALVSESIRVVDASRIRRTAIISCSSDESRSKNLIQKLKIRQGIQEFTLVLLT